MVGAAIHQTRGVIATLIPLLSAISLLCSVSSLALIVDYRYEQLNNLTFKVFSGRTAITSASYAVFITSLRRESLNRFGVSIGDGRSVGDDRFSSEQNPNDS